jgi:hypothetical protein
MKAFKLREDAERTLTLVNKEAEEEMGMPLRITDKVYVTPYGIVWHYFADANNTLYLATSEPFNRRPFTLVSDELEAVDFDEQA